MGAGPAGLTAAFYLALLGHEVTVFESHAEPGGMLRYALPEYRLPNSVLDREIEIIRRLGVKFVFNTRVGEDVSLNDLDAAFDAVFLSIGTWKESWVYLAGTELAGVRPALPFLEGVATGEAMPLGDHVVGHRRRQRRHRFRPHRRPPGRVGDRRLPARTQGHAGHRGRGGSRRGRRACASSSWPPPTASSAKTAR